MHPLQFTLPVLLANVPDRQALQFRLVAAPETVENKPAMQSRHVPLVVAPWSVENVPAIQFVQPALDGRPEAVENLPSEQRGQGTLVLWAVLYVPGTHIVHWLTELSPVFTEYVPAGQKLH